MRKLPILLCVMFAVIAAVPAAAYAGDAYAYVRNSSHGQAGTTANLWIVQRFENGDNYQMCMLYDPVYPDNEVGFAVEIGQLYSGGAFHPGVHIKYADSDNYREFLRIYTDQTASKGSYHTVKLTESEIGSDYWYAYMDGVRIRNEAYWWPHHEDLDSMTRAEAFDFLQGAADIGHIKTIYLRAKNGHWYLQDTTWPVGKGAGGTVIYDIGYIVQYSEWWALKL